MENFLRILPTRFPNFRKISLAPVFSRKKKKNTRRYGIRETVSKGKKNLYAEEAIGRAGQRSTFNKIDTERDDNNAKSLYAATIRCYAAATVRTAHKLSFHHRVLVWQKSETIYFFFFRNNEALLYTRSR